MNKIIVLLIFILVNLFWFGCQKENAINLKNVTIQGKTVDENGTVISGSTVSILEYSTVSDGNGAFELKATLEEGKRYLLTANSEDYFKASFSLDYKTGMSYYQVLMLGSVDARTTIDKVSGGTLTLNSGSKIVIPTNAVTLADGSAYEGDNIEIVVKELNQDLGALFSALIPGNTLKGIDVNGLSQELVSYGMLSIELFGDNGEILQLNPNSPAELTFVIPSSQMSQAPSSIPLWYFDEEEAVWKEEGVATKQGNSYIGTVSHFTTWNCDAPYPASTVTGCVIDSLGNPQVNLQLKVGQIITYTNAQGCFETQIPAQFLPIKVEVIESNNMLTCELFSFDNAVTPSTLLDLGNLSYSGICGHTGQLNIPDTITAGYGLTHTLLVRYGNSLGNGIVGVNIKATILSGGGAIADTIVPTDANGYANIQWTLGSTGVQKVRIKVGSTVREVYAKMIYGSMTDNRDGQVYPTIVIGNQTWLAENMRFDLPNTVAMGFDIYNPDNPSPVFGRHYNWYSAQQVCPQGWHLPSRSEWTTLETNLGGSIQAAIAMKSTSGWKYLGNGKNSSGFNAYPQGNCNILSLSFYLLGSHGSFWSSTLKANPLYSDGEGYMRFLFDGGNYTAISELRESYMRRDPYALGCRCVKD